MMPGTPVEGTISAGQDQYDQIYLPAGQEVSLTATSAVAGFASLFERFGSIPDATQFDESTSLAGQAAEPTEFVTVQSGFYYVMLEGLAAAGTGTSYTLTVSPETLSLTGLGASSASNVGQVTIPLFGTAFEAGMTANLVSASNAKSAARSVLFSSATEAFATFDLTSLAAGSYGVQVTANGQTSTLPSAFSVNAQAAGQFQAQLSFPNGTSNGDGRVEGLITYSNTGDTNVIAPLLVVSSGGLSGLRLDSSDPFSSNSLSLMAASPFGPAGILQPGQSGQITFQALPEAATAMTLNLSLSQESATSTDPLDFQTLESQVRPAGIPDSLWNPVYQIFENEAGTTWGSLVTLMAKATTSVGQQGGNPSSGTAVFGQIIEEAAWQLTGTVGGSVYVNSVHFPLASAQVQLTSLDGIQNYGGNTGADGSFWVNGVPAGTYDLSVVDFTLPGTVQVTVPASGSPSWLTEIVLPEATISGTITSQAGQAPLEGASVVASNTTDPNEFTATTITDAQGNYTLTGLNPGTYDLAIELDPFQTLQLQNIQVGQSAVFAGMNFALDTGSIVQGQVTANGAPVSSAQVLAIDSSGDTISATTDSHGDYPITDLSAGTYTIEAQATGLAVGQTTVTVGAGATTTVPGISLSSEANLTLTVTNASGTPVPNATVQVFLGENCVVNDTSDANGQVTLPGLSAGDYTVHSFADGTLDSVDDFTLTAGQSTRDLQRDRVGRRHADQRAPGRGGFVERSEPERLAVRGVDVTLGRHQGPEWNAGGECEHHGGEQSGRLAGNGRERGWWVVVDQPCSRPGTYTLQVSQSGYLGVRLGSVNVTAGTPATANATLTTLATDDLHTPFVVRGYDQGVAAAGGEAERTTVAAGGAVICLLWQGGGL